MLSYIFLPALDFLDSLGSAPSNLRKITKELQWNVHDLTKCLESWYNKYSSKIIRKSARKSKNDKNAKSNATNLGKKQLYELPHSGIYCWFLWAGNHDRSYRLSWDSTECVASLCVSMAVMVCDVFHYAESIWKRVAFTLATDIFLHFNREPLWNMKWNMNIATEYAKHVLNCWSEAHHPWSTEATGTHTTLLSALILQLFVHETVWNNIRHPSILFPNCKDI